MSTKRVTPLDMTGLEILNFLAHLIAGNPGSPIEGQVWYNSSTKKLMWRSDSANIDATARSNHTGTQLASTVSDFDAQVRTSRLDQMAAPTASISANNQKIINAANGTNPGDLVNFAQLEQARQGIRSKAAVEAAATANVTISNPGTAVFDGVTVANGESVLLPAQTTTSESGIYVFNGSGSALTRRDDADVFAELDAGAEVFVQGGTANGGKLFRQLTELTGFSGQSWSVVGTGTTYTAGSGLTESPAGTFNVGAGTGISVAADAVAVDTGLVARYKLFTIGDGSATSFTLAHNLGNQWVEARVIRNSSPFDHVETDAECTDANNATVRFAVAPTSNQYRALVIG